jgi:hypothetical protein
MITMRPSSRHGATPEADRQVATTLAELIIGGSLATGMAGSIPHATAAVTGMPDV